MKDEHKSKSQLLRELRNMRQRLAEVEASEERYHMLVEASKAGISLIAEDGTLIIQNSAAAAIWGKKPEDTIGKHYEFLGGSPEFNNECKKLLEISRQGQTIAHERYVKELDRCFLEDIRTVKKATGEFLGIRVATYDITERKRAEETQHNLSHDLNERVKELNCIYGISRLVETQVSLEEILKGTVELLPPALRYPEIACARINLDNKEFKTENFRETPWKQTCELIAYGEPRGSIQVGYLEEGH